MSKNNKKIDKVNINKKFKKLWFTLVELIVVITILAILWTIAFYSFQNYALSARDWTRISDIKSIQKSLSFFAIETWNFPEPTDWKIVTYSWASVWIQWTFWDTMMTNLWALNKKPKDPLKLMEYSYSVTPDKQEYQLVWVLESIELVNKNFLINKAYSYASPARAYSVWTYNWVASKVSTWWIEYVLAIPSIVTSDLSQTDITQILAKRSLVYNNYWSFPSNFTWAYSSDNQFNFYPNKLVIYTWSFDTLSGTLNQIHLLKGIQDAYSWTIVVSNDKQIKNIVDTVINEWDPSNTAKILACTLVNFSLRHFVACNNIDYVTYYIINVLHIDITSLPSADVNAVYRASNWDLRFWTDNWIGHYNWTTWEIFTYENTEHKLVSNLVVAIAEDTGWDIWFWTNKWVSIYDWTQWLDPITTDDWLKHNNVTSINVWVDWKIWIWTNSWLQTFDGEDWEIYKRNWNNSFNSVTAIYEDNKWYAWIWNNSRLDRYKMSNWAVNTYQTQQGLPNNYITFITQDKNNNIRIWTNNWLSRYNRTSFLNYTTTNTSWWLPSNKINYIYQDDVNWYLWFWTDNWAAKFLTWSNSWTVYNTSNGKLTWNNVVSITETLSWSIAVINDWWVDIITD